ncbi:MAG: phospholipid carrier-dependent glycosyltransferase [Chloroflexota bacterium]|nr:MAG: phospholipid carrier-dependent glycosyltransferase [Chloroflexota bacterium]
MTARCPGLFTIAPNLCHNTAHKNRYRCVEGEEGMTRNTPAYSRLDFLVGGLLGLCGFFLYFWRLAVPAQYIYDEIYHAYTAAQFALGHKEAYEWWTTPPPPAVSYEWTHPPLSKLLMAVGILTFGDNSFGWRIASVITGALALFLFYLLAKALLRSRPVAVTATLLLMLDGLFMVQSRTAMNDIFVTAGLLAAYVFLMAYLRVPCLSRRATGFLLAAAVCLGLGLASKWVAIYAIGGFGAIVAFRGLAAVFPVFRLRAASAESDGTQVVLDTLSVGSVSQEGQTQSAIGAVDVESDSGQARSASVLGSLLTLLLQLVALVAIPAALYVASYGQFFLMGHDLSQFVELQRQMWWYHTNLVATHDYASRWWTWPLLGRPVWFYVDRTDTTIANIYNLGNPLIWWPILPALVYLAYRYLRNATWASAVILMGYLIQWLPWEASPRIMFFYHMLPSLPFGVLALASSLQQLWGRGKLSRRVVLTYLPLVVVSFIFFYPIWTGWPLSFDSFNLRIWVPSWR